MKEMPPVDWRGLIQAPIARGLLLSAALHLALIALIHPAPGSGKTQTIVINARLEAVTAGPRNTAPALAAPPENLTETSKSLSETAVLAENTPAPSTFSMPVESGTMVEPAHAAVPTAPEPDRAHASTESAPPGLGPIAPSSLPSLPLDIDTTWYLARQVDVFPKSIGKIEPIYPEEARRRNLEGSLKLMLKIDDLGRVQEAEVVEAMPPGVFDEAALAAFRNARFKPAMRDGRPVRYQAYMRVDFRLEE